MGKLFKDNSLNLPEEKPLKETEEKYTPVCPLGDRIFPLKIWLMRPFLDRILMRNKEFITIVTVECAGLLKMHLTF